MKDSEIIDLILQAGEPVDLFDTTTYKKKYVEFLKQIHPDVCALPMANEACSKLNSFKRALDLPSMFDDDAGTIHLIDDVTMIQTGDKTLLEKSYTGYKKLKSFTDKASLHFHRYLPAHMEWVGSELKVSFEHPAVPLHKLILPIEHSIWVTSRMFECAAWLNQCGIVHGGFLPNSVALVPETHGVVLFSFYHWQEVNKKVQTLSATYQHWYPASLFHEKCATAKTDLSLIQHTALYLLGDKSGAGVKLKKKYPEAFINFLLASNEFPYETYDEYRALRSELFGKPIYFHLNL
jgi:hypothetical protein